MNKNISKISLFLKYYKVCDLFIHCLDARAIISSKITWINSYLQNKPILYVALKSDLLTKQEIEALKKHKFYQNIIFLNCKNFKFKKVVINKITTILKNKQKKWNVNNIFVFGYPNIGKSSLINLLTNKKSCKVENKLHVTKKESWIKINDNLRILDTPGILNKKITNMELKNKLMLINCLNCENDSKEELVIFALNYLLQFYSHRILNILKINSNLTIKDITLKELIITIKKHYFTIKKNIYLFLYQKIISNNINWDLDLIKLHDK